MSKIQPITATPSVPPRPQGEGNSNSNLAPNGTFNLWQMLMAIMKYEKTLLDNDADIQKKLAQALGGSNGIYQHLYNISAEVGVHEAEGLRADAFSKFAQAGVSGLSLGVSLGKYLGSTRPSVNAANKELKNLGDVEGKIGESKAGLKLADKASKPAIDSKIQTRLNEWAEGSRSIKLNDVNAEEQLINQKAAEHVAHDPNKAKIMEQIQKQKESAQGQISSAYNSYDRWGQINRTTAEGANAFAGGIGSLKQADAQEAKAKANAANTIVSQVQGQVVDQQNKMQQKAEEALQQANSWATSFANAASAQVHA